MKTIVLLLLLTSTAACPCLGEQAWTNVAKQGITTLSGTDDGMKVSVKIFSELVELPANEKPEDKSHSTDCTYTVSPCRAIYKLEITIADTQISVPRSSFCDLGDITNARIVPGTNREITIQFVGGDGDEGYYVYLRLTPKKIVERDVYSFAGPKAGPLEVTKYHSVQFQ